MYLIDFSSSIIVDHFRLSIRSSCDCVVVYSLANSLVSYERSAPQIDLVSGAPLDLAACLHQCHSCWMKYCISGAYTTHEPNECAL